MEQFLNEAISLSDGIGGKIVGTLSALLVTIMTVVKVVKWAAGNVETHVSDLANLILVELNRPIDKVVLKDTTSIKGQITTPEGIKVWKTFDLNPFKSVVRCLFKEEDVTDKLTKAERKIIRKCYFAAVARKLASIRADEQREFDSKVTAALNNAVRASGTCTNTTSRAI